MGFFSFLKTLSNGSSVSTSKYLFNDKIKNNNTTINTDVDRYNIDNIKNDNISENKMTVSTTTNKKVYDISVSETDVNGNPIEFIETGVHASSREALKELYNACGQKIRILREYDDPAIQSSNTAGIINPVVQPQQQNITTQSVSTSLPEIQSQPVSQVNTPVTIPQNTYSAKPQKIPAKYFSVGGIECKFEDGKIYQKQWVRAFGNEATNYRIISDSNNKEISMNGKHLEILKWVLVENENTDGVATESDNSNILLCENTR